MTDRAVVNQYVVRWFALGKREDTTRVVDSFAEAVDLAKRYVLDGDSVCVVQQVEQYRAVNVALVTYDKLTGIPSVREVRP